jgi:hypothetical protein
VFVESTKRTTSLKEYSDAVQSLFSRGVERLSDALFRVHNAHIKTLRDSGFPDPARVRESGKSLFVIVKNF